MTIQNLVDSSIIGTELFASDVKVLYQKTIDGVVTTVNTFNVGNTDLGNDRYTMPVPNTNPVEYYDMANFGTVLISLSGFGYNENSYGPLSLTTRLFPEDLRSGQNRVFFYLGGLEDGTVMKPIYMIIGDRTETAVNGNAFSKLDGFFLYFNNSNVAFPSDPFKARLTITGFNQKLIV